MPEPRTNEETLALMQEIAATKGDSFRVKVFRKLPAEAYPRVIGTFEDTRVEHLSDAQLWLPDYSGGGTYMLQASHTTEVARAVGGYLNFIIDGQPTNVNEAICSSPDWKGPRLIPRIHQRPMAIGIAGPDGTGAPPRNGDTSGSSVGASSHHQPTPTGGVSPEALRYSMAMQQLEAQREEMRRREAQMQEERHRNDMETMRREQEAREAKLRAEMVAASASRAESTPKGPGTMEIVTGLAAALTPIVAKMMESSEKAAERVAIMQQENAREMREMMKALAAPKGTDPLVSSILEANQRMLSEKSSAGAQLMEIVKPVISTVSEVTNFMMAQTAAMREMQGEPGEPENPIVKLAGKVADVLAAGAAAQAARGAPPAPQLPPAQAPSAPTRQAFAGVEAAPAAPAAPVAPAMQPAPTVFQQFIERIMRREDPKTLVVDYWNAVQANEPSIVVALQPAEGDPVIAFAPYLTGWLVKAPAHQQYARELIDALEEEGVKRGVLEAEEEVSDGQEQAAEA